MSDIPLFEIAWNESDIANVVESVSRGSYWAKGPFVNKFESGLEEYFGVEHALTVNSGTTALVCALHAHDVGPGDEVLVPSFTFIATANVVELVGATPVFVDIEPETFGMDPADAREKYTEDTAAILPVHCYGGPCRIEQLRDLADERAVPLIEDAAEAFGATINGRKIGTFGETAALSFCQNKVLPTGEGGAVLTDDEELAETIRRYRSHGRASKDYFESAGSGDYPSVGSNYRMPDLVAALGCSQIEKVERLIKDRRQVAMWYEEALTPVEGVSPVNPQIGSDYRHVYQLYTVEFDQATQRATVIDTLSDRGIACKIYWDPPVHLMEHYKRREHGNLDTSEEIASRVLSLPIYPGISYRDVERTVAAIRDGLP